MPTRSGAHYQLVYDFEPRTNNNPEAQAENNNPPVVMDNNAPVAPIEVPRPAVTRASVFRKAIPIVATLVCILAYIAIKLSVGLWELHFVDMGLVLSSTVMLLMSVSAETRASVFRKAVTIVMTFAFIKEVLFLPTYCGVGTALALASGPRSNMVNFVANKMFFTLVFRQVLPDRSLFAFGVRSLFAFGVERFGDHAMHTFKTPEPVFTAHAAWCGQFLSGMRLEGFGIDGEFCESYMAYAFNYVFLYDSDDSTYQEVPPTPPTVREDALACWIAVARTEDDIKTQAIVKYIMDRTMYKTISDEWAREMLRMCVSWKDEEFKQEFLTFLPINVIDTPEFVRNLLSSYFEATK